MRLRLFIDPKPSMCALQENLASRCPLCFALALLARKPPISCCVTTFSWFVLITLTNIEQVCTSTIYMSCIFLCVSIKIYIVSCCSILYYIILYNIVLNCIKLYYIILYNIVLNCIKLYHIILYCIVLFCIILCYIILCYIILYYIILYYITLYYITLHYIIVLYCVMLCFSFFKYYIYVAGL